MAGTQHHQGSLSQMNQDRDHGAQGRHGTSERQEPGSQVKREAPAGARCPSPGRPGDPSRASMCVFAVNCVSISPMLECNLWKTTSAEAMLRLRAMDLLRERKTVNVSA